MAPIPTSAPQSATPRLAMTGLALALLGAGLFATKGIVIKLALAAGVDTTTTLTWRMIVAVPIFVTLGWLSYRRRAGTSGGGPQTVARGDIVATLGVGLLGYYVASYLDFSALKYISAQLDRLILLLYPFFVVLFGAVFFKRRVTRAMILGQMVSYAGIALIFGYDFGFEGDDVLLGSALVLGSAVVYAAYQILAKPLIDRLGPQLFTSVAMSGAGPAVILHFFLTHSAADLAVPIGALPLMLAIGTVATVAPAYCISAAIGMIGPERTAVLGNISPLVTVSLAVFVLGEPFTPVHAIGTAMVLGGVMLFARTAKPKATAVDIEP